VQTRGNSRGRVGRGVTYITHIISLSSHSRCSSRMSMMSREALKAVS
jgi:hypothetical protein